MLLLELFLHLYGYIGVVKSTYRCLIPEPKWPRYRDEGAEFARFAPRITAVDGVRRTVKSKWSPVFFLDSKSKLEGSGKSNGFHLNGISRYATVSIEFLT